ncbi:hypothetical protein COT48_04690 [Candidatus Woesearchaeota archaeon CG08_land_8_20_14_0_20_47_9]|nr:MAG: hypothetical protein COT48_04690 [Candidatus Woesearchaeota archaeon CG08_land_8_20_14_0_20_47_9]
MIGLSNYIYTTPPHQFKKRGCSMQIKKRGSDVKKRNEPVDEAKAKERIRRSLRYSILDAAGFSAASGFGDNYVSPFAIFLGATNMQIGLLRSVPRLLGALFQLLAAEITDRLKKRKRIILTAVLIQALCWLPMLLLPLLFPRLSFYFVLMFFSLYVIALELTGPAWNSMMGDLVPANKRGRFFGYRNRVAGIITLASLVIAGLTLNYFSRVNTWVGFSILFAVALLAKIFSLTMLSRMYEPEYVVSREHCFSFLDFIRRARRSNFAVFVLYVGLINLTTQIAGPFFNVFMLRELNFSYARFMTISAASAFTSFALMYYWGRQGDVFGTKKIITITGLLIPIVPIFWLFSHNLAYLVLVNLFAGFVWAGFNISAANFIFDAVTPPKRARCVAYYAFIIGVCVFLGATLGGVIAGQLKTSWIFFSRLQVIFLVSGLLRLAVTLFFIGRFREVRVVREVKTSRLFWQLLFLNPALELRTSIASGLSSVAKSSRRKRR